jgi:hypothetical protein
MEEERQPKKAKFTRGDLEDELKVAAPKGLASHGLASFVGMMQLHFFGQFEMMAVQLDVRSLLSLYAASYELNAYLNDALGEKFWKAVVLGDLSNDPIVNGDVVSEDVTKMEFITDHIADVAGALNVGFWKLVYIATMRNSGIFGGQRYIRIFDETNLAKSRFIAQVVPTLYYKDSLKKGLVNEYNILRSETDEEASAYARVKKIPGYRRHQHYVSPLNPRSGSTLRCLPTMIINQFRDTALKNKMRDSNDRISKFYEDNPTRFFIDQTLARSQFSSKMYPLKVSGKKLVRIQSRQNERDYNSDLPSAIGGGEEEFEDAPILINVNTDVNTFEYIDEKDLDVYVDLNYDQTYLKLLRITLKSLWCLSKYFLNVERRNAILYPSQRRVESSLPLFYIESKEHHFRECFKIDGESHGQVVHSSGSTCKHKIPTEMYKKWLQEYKGDLDNPCPLC